MNCKFITIVYKNLMLGSSLKLFKNTSSPTKASHYLSVSSCPGHRDF
jgi:hypothetical protein